MMEDIIMKTAKKCFSAKKSLLCALTAVLLLTGLVPAVPVQAATIYTPDYSLIFDAEYYYKKYEDLEDAFGKNPFHLFNHFLTNGMREGRQAKKSFNVYNYAANNLDLIVRFGTNDLSKYYMHYITEGYREGRSCETPYSPDDESDKGTVVDADTLNSYARSVVDMINQTRTSIGVDALANASDVNAAAALRAQDLMSLYSHNRPNGRSYTNALDLYAVKYTDSYEVIANGISTPANVMADWTGSSDISYNLTSKDFKYIGVGCACDSSGKLYWVLLLTY